MYEGVHLHKCLYNETSLFNSWNLLKCTDQEVKCTPQRLLRREGDADLKEKCGHTINTAPITLIHEDYKIQTCTNTPTKNTVLRGHKLSSKKCSADTREANQPYSKQYKAQQFGSLWSYLVFHFSTRCYTTEN